MKLRNAPLTYEQAKADIEEIRRERQSQQSEQRKACQGRLRRGGDFSVSADKRKNTTGSLDKEPKV